eukprot:TRINITY_DN7440_c1_g2_i1.p1 TRINITY_DN7440_c1_g2~~TRINITY_DN7440_c1_g2_i1.p1  ORF type:complete len:316 (-),score=29.01 TRINITY_DN7440_c1_g2_i1:141-1088(-)
MTELLPNLIGIGTQKGGTTAFHSYLSKHKEVCSATIKEVHYFDQCMPTNLQDYLTNFQMEGARQCKYRLEVTPTYIVFPDAACFMSIVVPDAKFVLALRDPIVRFMSQYSMQTSIFANNQYHSFLRNISFEALVDMGISELEDKNCTFQNSNYYDVNSMYRCFGCKSNLRSDNHLQRDRLHVQYKFRVPMMVVRGMYLPQIKWWLQFFEKSQMWMLDSHELRNDTQKNMGEMFSFLGLEIVQEELAPVFVSKKPKIHDVTTFARGLQKLHEFFHPQIVELRDFCVLEFGEKWKSIEKWPSYSETFSAEDFLKNFM